MFVRPVWSFHDVDVVGLYEQSPITLTQTIRVALLEVGNTVRWARKTRISHSAKPFLNRFDKIKGHRFASGRARQSHRDYGLRSALTQTQETMPITHSTGVIGSGTG